MATIFAFACAVLLIWQASKFNRRASNIEDAYGRSDDKFFALTWVLKLLSVIVTIGALSFVLAGIALWRQAMDKKQKCSRGNGSTGANNRLKGHSHYITELKAIVNDILSGALPLRELPRFVGWLLGGAKWTSS